MMSTGLPRDQAGGSTASSFASVAARQRREPPAALLQRIGGEHAGAAAIGQDGEPVADARRARQRASSPPRTARATG